MAPGSSRLLRSATIQEVQPTNSTQPSQATNPDTPMSSAASTMTKKVRGPTRGKGLQRIIKTTGKKMVIEISKEKGRPVNNEQSAKLSNEIGVITRNLIRVPTKWKELNDEDKQVAFARLTEMFEINLDDHAKQSCENLMNDRSRSQRSRLRKKYLKCGSPEEGRRNVPLGMSQDEWNRLCDLFDSPRHQRQCAINQNNRSKQTVKHNQGSKAFVVVRHELSMVDGAERDRITFFKDTHFKDGKWTSPEAELLYNEMKSLESEATSEGGTSLTR